MSPYDKLPKLTEEEATAKTQPTAPLWEGFVYVRNIFGRWAMIHETDRGVPCVDPSYETYWCM